MEVHNGTARYKLFEALEQSEVFKAASDWIAQHPEHMIDGIAIAFEDRYANWLLTLYYEHAWEGKDAQGRNST